MKKVPCQKIEFNIVPTENPDETVGSSRYVVNMATGLGIDVLKKIIEENIPIAKNSKTETVKTIIRTERYECPCCPVNITALVYVNCWGLITKECRAIEGLYEVEVYSRVGAHGSYSEAYVKKLAGEIIYKGRTDGIPSKDYDANPKLAKKMPLSQNSVQKNKKRCFSPDSIYCGRGFLITHLTTVIIPEPFGEDNCAEP
ncbi:MAG: hypothetical protein HYT94_03435 [Parcubacteria group bacterium]|nr:hypothetical protein [Parcubacteria group bacterium]